MALPLMMLTIFGLMMAVALLIYASIKGAGELMKFVVGSVVVWLGIYFALLLNTSFKSQEKVLAWNEPKAFCGFYLDCHLHAAVMNVKQAKTIGEGANQKTAQGTFHVVTVKIFSDAKRATLSLANPQAVVVDEKGRTFNRATEAEQALEATTNKAIPFDKQVGPAGDSFTKEIVFDLPNDARGPRLQITQGYAIDRALELFLIGDEDSLFHKRARFSLEPQGATANVS
jgi:hypothetical protein